VTLDDAAWEIVRVVTGCGMAALLALLLPIRERSLRRPRAWVALAAAVAFVAYGGIALAKLRAYNMGAEDLGRIDQAIWNVRNGELLVFSASEIGRPMSRLAGHVELLYVPLAALFSLWDSAAILLLAQAAVVALGAWPAYRIGERVGDGWLGLASAIAYLAHPAVGYATLADIHGDTLAMPLLLLAIERALAGRRVGCWLAMALAVAGKEYVATLAISFGLLLLVARKDCDTGLRRDRALGGALVALGLVWLLAVVPAFHAIYRPPDFPQLTPLYYDDLGSTPLEVVVTGLTEPRRVLERIVTPRKLGVLLVLLAPFAFASLARPSLLAVTLPVLVPLAVSDHLDLRNHHNATLIPFLLAAAVLGAHRLLGARAAPALLAATAVAHLTIGPSPLSIRSWTPGRWDYLLNPHIAGRTAHDEVLDEAIATIGADERVSASSHLVPHLSHRPTCFTFPAPVGGAGIDVAVVDLRDAYPPPYRPRQDEIAALRRLLETHHFHVHYARDGVWIVRRSPPSEPSRRGVAYQPPEPLAVGPLVVETDGSGGLLWTATRTIDHPLLLLHDGTRAVGDLPSPLIAPLPWLAGDSIVTPGRVPAAGRIESLELHEGSPALVGVDPPQPWLPDPQAGTRLLPVQ